MSESSANDCPNIVKPDRTCGPLIGTRTKVDQAWAGEMDCFHCTLRASVLFAGLTQPEFELIHNHITQFTLAPGEMLYRAGEAVHSLFTVRSGLIKHVRILPDGTQRILRLSSKTDVLGLEALVLNTYQNDATAIHTTDICVLPAKIIRQLVKNNMVLYQELMRRWQLALDAADTWIVELSTGSARARVARLLLKLTTTDDPNHCELVSREDMGAMLGVTTETASRTVAEFKRNGLLKEIALNKCYLDVNKLKHIATD